MRRAGLLLIAVAASCGIAGDAGVPRIDQVRPDLAKAGDVVDILGDGFCGQDPNDVGPDETCAASIQGFVTVGATAGIPRTDGRVRLWMKTRVQVTLPAAPPGATTVVVTVTGRQSNGKDFTVIP